MNSYRVEFVDGTWADIQAVSLGSLYGILRTEAYPKRIDKIFKRATYLELVYKKS